MLRAENASPKVSGVFYKATVQAVLLFGSEMWKLSPVNLKSLEGFHIKAAQLMAGIQPIRTRYAGSLALCLESPIVGKGPEYR